MMGQKAFWPNRPECTVRSRIFPLSLSTAVLWLPKAEFFRLIAGKHGGHVGFPCFGPARAHLSRIKRAPIAGGHSAGNTDAGGEAAVACRVPEQPAVRISSPTRSRFQSLCWFLDLTFERSPAAWESAPR